MKRILVLFAVLIVILMAASCTQPSGVSQPPLSPASPGGQPELSAPAPSPVPTPAPLPSPVPSPTPETPVSLGKGDVLFDIYQHMASRDINLDGVDELIVFTPGEASSIVNIAGKDYEVPKPGLAGCFAITDVNKNDKILELLFTDRYDPALPEGKFAFSHLYWWNGTDLLFMGGLMDVKFDGAWRDGFDPAQHFDAKNMVMCLTDTHQLTYLLYMGHYKPSGSKRKLDEVSYAATPLGDVKKIKCKKKVLLLEDLTNDYFNSAYDYYWIPTLWPYTAARTPHVCEGVEIIAQPGEWLSIVKVYGKSWFKLKTSDGYSGWMKLNNGKPLLDPTVGWTLSDIFSGL